MEVKQEDCHCLYSREGAYIDEAATPTGANPHDGRPPPVDSKGAPCRMEAALVFVSIEKGCFFSCFIETPGREPFDAKLLVYGAVLLPRAARPRPSLGPQRVRIGARPHTPPPPPLLLLRQQFPAHGPRLCAPHQPHHRPRRTHDHATWCLCTRRHAGDALR